MDQILIEAQSRWLRPAEICQILCNYKKFPIASEPPYKPPGGSLFLFDRKILRYFRKDGHNWRKKKDGKTVREAHERLKAGSIDVLHCYYAHGEGNENFQRRSYWMLEEELSHIVLVHYRHVKGNRASISCIQEANYQLLCARKKAESLNVQKTNNGFSSSFHASVSLTADSPSMNNTRSSDGANAESGYNQWISSNHHSILDVLQPGLGNSGSCKGKVSLSSDMEFFPLALPREPSKGYRDEKWEDALPYCNGVRSLPSTSSHQAIEADVADREMITSGPLSEDVPGRRRELCTNLSFTDDWLSELTHDVNFPIDPKFIQPSYDLTNSFLDERENIMGYGGCDRRHRALPNEQLSYVTPTHHETQHDVVLNNVNLDSLFEPYFEGKANFLFAAKEHLFDIPSSQVLTKVDSFDKWMSSQLGDVDDSHIDSTSSAYWEAVESGDAVDDAGIATEMHLECYSLAPSLSQDQLFSIIDFSPNWTYEGAKTKILITGKFLKLNADVANCEWSCMFGEVEVPAEPVSGDSLCCWTPLHKPGRIPFYITSSNRIACSEVREFEYRVNPHDRVDTLVLEKDTSDDAVFITRLFKFLTLEPSSAPYPYETDEKVNEIISLLMVEYDESPQTAENSFKDKSLAMGKAESEPLQKQFKLKLLKWLIVKVNEGGKGPNVLGESGQGVLHLVAALGYYWAIAPVIISGGNVNFRDMNGWTALHWAASFGRERTVVSLLSQGAAPGALTDPILSYPSGRTPADLASAKGHKGIAGYLAESALSAHLASLNVEDPGKCDGTGAVAQSKCRTSSLTNSDLSYKDSLTAVCNATLAAARIHQVFRVQSFQRKQLKELRDHPVEISEENAFSFLVAKTRKSGHRDESVHDAAIRIQNKFRSWKGRNDFLKIRQRVVKIQAHVRGYQVRKNYRKIVWSVGILEKVILRWRRKRSGLRGFRSDALVGSSSREVPSSEEDDFDFLREGRRQTEQRLQKALARVKSMVQYPEARDQYQRLLTVVTEIQAPKVGQDGRPSTSREEEVTSDDDFMDIEALLDDEDSSED